MVLDGYGAEQEEYEDKVAVVKLRSRFISNWKEGTRHGSFLRSGDYSRAPPIMHMILQICTVNSFKLLAVWSAMYNVGVSCLCTYTSYTYSGCIGKKLPTIKQGLRCGQHGIMKHSCSGF